MSAWPNAGATGLGNTEQLADDGERQRERERFDEVDDFVGAARRDRVEHVVDDPLNLVVQRFDAPHRERRRDQPPQARVVGRVDREHVAREGRPRESLRHDIARRRERGLHVFRDSLIVERGARLVVPDDQPRVVTVGERDGVHRPERTDLFEQRIGIVAVELAPRGQRFLQTRHRSSSSAPTPECNRATTRSLRQAGASCSVKPCCIANNAASVRVEIPSLL